MAEGGLGVMTGRGASAVEAKGRESRSQRTRQPEAGAHDSSRDAAERNWWGEPLPPRREHCDQVASEGEAALDADVRLSGGSGGRPSGREWRRRRDGGEVRGWLPRARRQEGAVRLEGVSFGGEPADSGVGVSRRAVYLYFPPPTLRLTRSGLGAPRLDLAREDRLGRYGGSAAGLPIAGTDTSMRATSPRANSLPKWRSRHIQRKYQLPIIWRQRPRDSTHRAPGAG